MICKCLEWQAVANAWQWHILLRRQPPLGTGSADIYIYICSLYLYIPRIYIMCMLVTSLSW